MAGVEALADNVENLHLASVFGTVDNVVFHIDVKIVPDRFFFGDFKSQKERCRQEYTSQGDIKCNTLFLTKSYKFANPEDKGCSTDDDYPVNEFQRFNIEKIATNTDNQYLTNKDYEGNETETATTFEVER